MRTHFLISENKMARTCLSKVEITADHMRRLNEEWLKKDAGLDNPETYRRLGELCQDWTPH